MITLAIISGTLKGLWGLGMMGAFRVLATVLAVGVGLLFSQDPLVQAQTQIRNSQIAGLRSDLNDQARKTEEIQRTLTVIQIDIATLRTLTADIQTRRGNEDKDIWLYVILALLAALVGDRTLARVKEAHGG